MQGKTGMRRRFPCISVCVIALSTAVHAGDAIDEPTPPEQIELFRNLCEMQTVTSGPYDHTHAYPTARTWSRDSRSIFIEGSGPGPDGRVEKNTRHLMAVNVESGEKKYLVSNVNPNADNHAGGFMFDYAPAANCILYAGPTAKKIYLLNLDTMKTGLLAEEPEGTIGGPLTIAWDGTRVAYWTMMPSIANRFFDDYITVILYVDVDPAACKPLSEPRIIEAYPRRKGSTWTKEATRDAVHVNHPQINPKNKHHICYSHEMLGSRPDGTINRCRLWQTMVDETKKRPLVRQPAGLDFTHEVIAPDGKSLIFPYMFGVGQVFFDTGRVRSIYYNRHCCPGHLTVSPDGKWIAGDTWGRPKDLSGKERQSVMMFETATRKFAHLVWFNYSHPHPNFSPDGAKIAFSYRDDHGHQQIAYIKVGEVKKNWATVAQGVGGAASPAWKAALPY